MRIKRILCLALAAVLMNEARDAEAAEANYDEAKVPQYELPDPLVFEDGRPVRRARQWERRRRAEILELFAEHMYGRSPGRPADLRFEVFEEATPALDGKALRKQARAHFTDRPDGPWMDILLYLPANREGRVPVFLGLNFEGNHAVTKDPGVRLSSSWMRNDEREGRVNNRATERSRGSESSRWPVEKILARGYALATIYYGDIEPDHAEGWRTTVRSVFPADAGNPAKPASERITELASDAWGAIGAWAWGLSRAVDYLETEPAIDARRVAVIGHSRLGKTALWAGAQDERIALVISNNSGCGGAALSRRQFGETVARINTVFPHWFCGNFKRYNDREADLPVDQHELIALIAPRPVYVASAEKDLWADPRGEFLAAKHATPVYELLGVPGLTAADMPGLNEPTGAHIRYHIRTGVHDVTDYDWDQYLNFADERFGAPTR